MVSATAPMSVSESLQRHVRSIPLLHCTVVGPYSVSQQSVIISMVSQQSVIMSVVSQQSVIRSVVSQQSVIQCANQLSELLRIVNISSIH